MEPGCGSLRLRTRRRVPRLHSSGRWRSAGDCRSECTLTWWHRSSGSGRWLQEAVSLRPVAQLPSTARPQCHGTELAVRGEYVEVGHPEHSGQVASKLCGNSRDRTYTRGERAEVHAEAAGCGASGVRQYGGVDLEG